jgi:uncharacterized protein YlxW (UPF0749 family)
MSDSSLERDIGRMEAEIKGLKHSLDEMRDDLREIKTAFHQMKGGSKVVLGLAAITGSGLTYLINWLAGKY